MSYYSGVVLQHLFHFSSTYIALLHLPTNESLSFETKILFPFGVSALVLPNVVNLGHEGLSVSRKY